MNTAQRRGAAPGLVDRTVDRILEGDGLATEAELEVPIYRSGLDCTGVRGGTGRTGRRTRLGRESRL